MKTKPYKLPTLTPREVVLELQGEIKVYEQSYTEADGIIRNPGALRTIAALSQARAAVRQAITRAWAVHRRLSRPENEL